jgi:hypothetical protein
MFVLILPDLWLERLGVAFEDLENGFFALVFVVAVVVAADAVAAIARDACGKAVAVQLEASRFLAVAGNCCWRHALDRKRLRIIAMNRNRELNFTIPKAEPLPANLPEVNSVEMFVGRDGLRSTLLWTRAHPQGSRGHDFERHRGLRLQSMVDRGQICHAILAKGRFGDAPLDWSSYCAFVHN